MPRKMAKPGRKRGTSEIPVDSFSDIAFLLIIFFVLTLSLVKYQGFTMDLPSSEKSKSETKDKDNTVVMTPTGLTFNGQELANGVEDLRSKLNDLNLASQPQKNRMVVLESYSGVKYENYYPIMAAIAKAGGIVTLVEDEDDASGSGGEK